MYNQTYEVLRDLPKDQRSLLSGCYSNGTGCFCALGRVVPVLQSLPKFLLGVEIDNLQFGLPGYLPANTALLWSIHMGLENLGLTLGEAKELQSACDRFHLGDNIPEVCRARFEWVLKWLEGRISP